MSAENGGGRDGGAEASVAAILAAATVTPIAQLGPDLTDSFGSIPRAVRGDVTIVWPYNSVNRSLAFLLAEPDVRLRRSKGQIRVQLHGASAAAVAESGLGGGDELLLSLQGASWSKGESSLKLPGSRVEWQLEFRGRIVLQAKVGEAQEARAIDINQPDEEEANGNPEIVVVVERDDTNGNASPDYAPPPSSPPIGDLFRSPMPPPRATLSSNNEEYASPAFIKRARISFGSLFEPGFDIFEEDGGVRGRGRKRTRFGRPSNSWRYSSRSVSPEAEPRQETPPEDDEESEDGEKEVAATSPPVALGIATPTPAPRPEPATAAAPKSSVPQTEAQPQQVDQSLRSSPPLPTSRLETPTPANHQEPAQPTAVPAIATSTTTVFGSVPEVQMGGMPNPFATSQRSTSALFGASAQPPASNPFGASALPTSTNPFGAPASSATTNPFGAPASTSSTSNPFGAPAVTENSNSFGAPAAVPFGTPGADAMGFVPDAGLFNDHVRFSFGDPANAFEQQPHLEHTHTHDTEVPALPSAEDHFAESQYQYPEPPSQHPPSHASAFASHPEPSEPSEPPRSTAQDQMLVWPISAPTLDAEHAEGAIPADTLPASHPPTAADTPEPSTNANATTAAAASFIASGANEGVFEDDTAEMASDLPREVDAYGYNDRRYQNEQEEAMVGMVDEPPSRQSEEDDLESDGPEEAEPTDHLIAEDEDEDEDEEGIENDAEGEGDGDGDGDGIEHVEVIDEDGDVQIEEEDDEEESDEDVDSEVEKTDQPGDDYDMRSYANIDDDIEGDEEPDEQGGAATFNGEGEDGEDDEDDDEEEEEEDYDEKEDADAEADDDDHYAAAPQHSFSTGRRLDEDGEEEEEELGSEEYDEEEEEDYDEDEEEEEEENGGHQSMGYQRPRIYQPPARPSQPAEPVVIDLLSDSDDDDAPPPPPRQQSKPVSETPIPPPSVPGFGQPSGAPRHPEAASSPPEEEEEDDDEEGDYDEEGNDELMEDEAEEAEEDEEEEEEEEEPGEDEAEDVASVHSEDEMEVEEPEPEQKQDEPATADAELEAESESEDEVEKELEAELDAELAADAEAEAEAEKAQEVEEVKEALPADAEKVEAVVIEEPTEAEAQPTEDVEVVIEETAEQPTVTAPIEVEIEEVDNDEAAPEVVLEAVVDDASEEPAETEVTAPEPPKSPAVVEVEPVAEDQPDLKNESQGQQDVDSDDVAMAEADVEMQEEAQPEQPPAEVVIELPEAPPSPPAPPAPPAPEPAHKTRSQTAHLAQETTAAASAPASASETPFSPPPTQQATSQDDVAEVAVVELPSLPSLPGTQTADYAESSGEPSAAPAQALLPTPMQTQDGGVDASTERHDHFQGASFTYTEVTSIAEEEDIDGQIQSQILSEMAMSFDFDQQREQQQQQQQQTDTDMHSVASGADVDMADGDNNDNNDDQMMDEEAAQTPRQTAQDNGDNGDNGDSMDVDAGTDIDMQSVVEEVLEEFDIIVTEPAPEDEASDVAVQPADETTEARADEAEAPATTLHKDATADATTDAPTEENVEQTKSSQDDEQQDDQQHLQVTTEDTAAATATAIEGRHKMSLRSTNSRLRRSLSPQPVVPSNTANDAANDAANKSFDKAAASAAAMTAAVADAASPEEPDASVQIARGATTRRSKRARAASGSQPAASASQDDMTGATATTAAAAAAAVTPNPAKEEDAAGEDVSVLIARGATSKKRTTPKAKDKEKEVDVTTAAPPPSMAEVKLALDRCRDTVPDCVQLRNLRPRLRTLLDVAVVATSSSDDHPPRRTRARQYAMSLTATDPSLVEHVSASRHHLHNLHGGTGSRKASPAAITNVAAAAAAANDNASDAGSVSVSTSVAAGADIDAIIEVSLFRAHKDTLPTFRAGDGLLLRRFEVVALHDKGFGLRSTDESAYVVFPAKEVTVPVEEPGVSVTEESGADASPPPQVNGPPVEDMDREAQYISLLKQWYRLLDDGARAQLSAANARFVAVDEAARLVGGESQ